MRIKSTANFKKCNELIISSTNFPKDVTFDNIENLKLTSCQFAQKIQFKETVTSFIEISNIQIKNLEIDSVYTLHIINNSKISGNLIAKGTNQNILIESSEIDKNLEIHDAKNFTCKEVQIAGRTDLIGKFNEVIFESTNVEELFLSTVHTLEIAHSTINKSCSIKCEENEKILLKDNTFKDYVEIKNSHLLKLEWVTIEKELKLEAEEYQKVDIIFATLMDVKFSSIEDLHISDTKLLGDVHFDGNDYEVIIFTEVETHKKCVFPKADTHRIELKNSNIKERVTFNGGRDFIFTGTEFKSSIEFLEKYTNIEFDDCKIYGKLIVQQVEEEVKITSSTLCDKVSMKETKIKNLNILYSNFLKSLDLSFSHIDNIYFNIEENNSKKSIFDGFVDLTSVVCKNIKANHCGFNDALTLVNFKSETGFSQISNTQINQLCILKSNVSNLFSNSKYLKIKEMSLEDVKLTSNSSDDDISIRNIEIGELHWNKISTVKNINLIDMKIQKFRITNCNFEHLIRIKFSSIEIINLISNTFEDLQIIENKNEKFEDNRELRLKNTTIKNAVFDKLKYNKFIMSDAHVSDAKIGNVTFKQGSRETNRFFKNYYDSISDYIQANNYYKQEMLEQYKIVKRFSSEWLVLDIGKGISNFGSSWFKPLMWMFLYTLVFYRIANFDLLSLQGFRENHISWMLNDVLRFTNPFSKNSITNYGTFYWAWITHKVFMSVFIYHFVVAVKQKTRR